MAESPVAIVTGGAQGLGAAISKALMHEGYRVCVSDVQREKGQQFVAELEQKFGKGKAIFVGCDVTKKSEFESLFDVALKQYKHVHVLVNNAGILNELNPQRMIEINVLGVNNGCRTALKYLGKSRGGKGGFVVNTASIAGFLPHPGFPVYVASKHAVIGLTRSYGHAYYFDKEGVMFSALCPSYVNTDLLQDVENQSLMAGLDTTQRKDLMSPDFVAQGVIKLLKDKINGSTLVVEKEFGLQYVGLPRELEELSLE